MGALIFSVLETLDLIPGGGLEGQLSTCRQTQIELAAYTYCRGAVVQLVGTLQLQASRRLRRGHFSDCKDEAAKNVLASLGHCKPLGACGQKTYVAGRSLAEASHAASETSLIVRVARQVYESAAT